jgi:hypothetical protein
MLAAHPAVLALPETHALWGLESRNPLRRRAGFRSDDVSGAWSQLPELGVPVPVVAPRRVGPYVRAVVDALDRAARAADRDAWSEKTPGHLRSAPLIEAYAPRAHVVHVVRPGVPAVTSLFAVTQEHGASWSGERAIELCLTRWRNDLQRTWKFSGKPRHHVVAYESLVTEPRRVLAALVVRLTLPGDAGEAAETMVAGYRHQAPALASPDEVWKTGTSQRLVDRSHAWTDLLSEAEAEQVRQGVDEVGQVYASLPFV